MPFKSNQQRKWAHTQDGMDALGGPAKVKEWDVASKSMSAPKRINPIATRETRPNPIDYEKAPNFLKLKKMMGK